MFNLGDIVRPKKEYIGNHFQFKIKEIELQPSEENLYKLERITQSLDMLDSDISYQLLEIKSVEDSIWKENELELAGPTPAYPQEIIHKGINSPTEQELNFFRTIVKGENNTMKILDLYEERKRKAIEKEYAEVKEIARKDDEIQKIIIEMTNQVNTILENQGSTAVYEFNPSLVTAKTQERFEMLEKGKDKEIENLRSTLEEIRALFEMTEDYQERMKILKKYDIINKDGKLSI